MDSTQDSSGERWGSSLPKKHFVSTTFPYTPDCYWDTRKYAKSNEDIQRYSSNYRSEREWHETNCDGLDSILDHYNEDEEMPPKAAYKGKEPAKTQKGRVFPVINHSAPIKEILMQNVEAGPSEPQKKQKPKPKKK